MTGTLYPCMCVAPDAHSVHKVCIAAFDDHVAITLFGGEARCAFPKFNSRQVPGWCSADTRECGERGLMTRRTAYLASTPGVRGGSGIRRELRWPVKYDQNHWRCTRKRFCTCGRDRM
jgi:hypothetical protein